MTMTNVVQIEFSCDFPECPGNELIGPVDEATSAAHVAAAHGWTYVAELDFPGREAINAILLCPSHAQAFRKFYGQVQVDDDGTIEYGEIDDWREAKIWGSPVIRALLSGAQSDATMSEYTDRSTHDYSKPDYS